MIRILVNINESTRGMTCEGDRDGRRLTKLEMAYYLSKFISAIIRDGAVDVGAPIESATNGGDGRIYRP